VEARLDEVEVRPDEVEGEAAGEDLVDEEEVEEVQVEDEVDLEDEMKVLLRKLWVRNILVDMLECMLL
jgi:hypothetical protein